VSRPKSAAIREGEALLAQVDFSVEGLGACPRLGPCLRLGCSLHAMSRGYLEALSIEALGLTDKQLERMLKSSIPFQSEDWNPFPSPRWRS
jgi:hypothetical protein